MKVYFKGFLKGLLILIVLFTIGMFLPEDSPVSRLLIPGICLAITIYIIRKNHIMAAWAILPIIIGAFSMPFIFGYRETKLVKKNK